MVHPLTAALIERLRECPAARVLELGSGNGRHTCALQAAGLVVVAIPDARVHAPWPQVSDPFDALLSTHGLLHGTREQVAATLDRALRLLRDGAAVFAAFGSTADPRYGTGVRIAQGCYAPEEGDERGIPHAYFDRAALSGLLREAGLVPEAIEELDATASVGRWAHASLPTQVIHWHVRSAKSQKKHETDRHAD